MLDSPLGGAEMARWKAEAGDVILRGGVLAAVDRMRVDRWIFDGNVEAIVSLLSLIVNRG